MASKKRSAKKSRSKESAAARSRWKRFTPEQRAAILSEASGQKLTGKQVAKKYGISTVTYYLWRKQSGRITWGPGRPRGTKGSGDGIADAARTAVREKVREVLPGIVRDEVARAIDAMFGSRRRRQER
jgi:transposase-like protein